MNTERIELKVSKELKQKIREDAKKLNLGISSYIRMMLSK